MAKSAVNEILLRPEIIQLKLIRNKTIQVLLQEYFPFKNGKKVKKSIKIRKSDKKAQHLLESYYTFAIMFMVLLITRFSLYVPL